MGLIKAFSAVANSVGGTKWAPEKELPAYAKTKETHPRQTEHHSLSAGEIMDAFRLLTRLKEDMSEAQRAVEQAEERCNALYHKAVEMGHTGNSDADAYAAGLPNYLCAGTFSSEAIYLAIGRQQCLALHSAAQITLAAAQSNAKAKESVYQHALKVFEQNLEYVTAERDFFRKESALLKRERVAMYRQMQSPVERPHTSSGHYSTPPATPPADRPRHSSNRSRRSRDDELESRASETLSPALAYRDLFSS